MAPCGPEIPGEAMRNGFRLGAFTVFLLAVASITGEAGCERALVAYGDVNTVDTWSGIPYFFLRAGRQSAFVRGHLRPGRFRRRRTLWNALRPPLNRPGGFMYSRAHLHALWDDRRAPNGIGEYVSHIQSLPPRERSASR